MADINALLLLSIVRCVFRARFIEAKLSCFCWCVNALMKSTRLESFQRDHGKRVQFTSETSIWKYWSVLFD